MNVIELARIAANVRHAQTRYFQTRSHSALQESKRLEKKLDHCLAIILDGQRELAFDEETTDG
uniref:Uncharacterized protein n=1 Tax=viral metagenome TaxID=1070528 RepID=A0A6M3KUR5_9ZZZZ